ncbi:MAG: NAD(+)/NADH kinase [Candidatus Thermoplasmatota archaeon]|nr:NAD(+)/NADH kinase [Candidatus Thermoplasmatota archaeon]
MDKIGISASPTLKDSVNTLRDIVETVRRHEVEAVLEKELAHMLGEQGGMEMEDMEDGKPLDFLITIGGDGTVLRALHHCKAPIFGVNMGRVGFLNEVSPEKFHEAFHRVMEGKYVIDHHTRILTKINGEACTPILNEAVIHSSQSVKMREFEVWLDGNVLDHFRSDGLIVATPTGSTGYALSAGGPLLDPRLQGFLIQPLAPFRISKRPNVIPLESVLKVKITNHRPCIINLDGQKEIRLEGSEEIEFTDAKDPARFLRFESNPYRIRQRAFETLVQ